MKVRTITQGFFQCFFWVLLLSSNFLLSVKTFAQTTTGSIYGTVADSSGAVIPNASVVVTDIATGTRHSAASNGSGDYVFPALNPSNYNVSISVVGFSSVTQQNVALSSNQNVHVNFALEAGSVNQTVMISASTELVDTRESQLATTVDQRRIEELPLNGRNVYDLVQLAPGVSTYTADSNTGSRVGVKFSLNDLPANSASYYLDGTPDLAFYQNGGDLLPNPDALQEFRLLTSNFDAEFGRQPGGVVNVITRSGTKSYHGMAYEYLRNNIFNAKNYFVTQTTPLKQNQFGGNFGGPLPMSKRQGFFFGSFETLIVHTPAIVGPTAITTATPLERMGDFRQAPPAIKAELTGLFCGTTQYVICPSTTSSFGYKTGQAVLDLVAQNALAFVPVENTNASGTEVGSTTQQDANANQLVRQGLGRIDFTLTPVHQLEALFFNSRGTIAAPNVGPNQIFSYSGMNQYENQVNTALVDTWSISSRTINTLRGFYTQNLYNISNTFTSHFLPDLGSLAPSGGAIAAPPAFVVNGYWTMGTKSNGPSDISQLSFGLFDTANLTRGHHEIKLGASYIWEHYQETGGLQTNGIFTFTGAATAVSGSKTATGNALADFLEGKANTFTQTTQVIHRSHGYDPALFAQDDWQITPRLNLNLGFRWEVFGPFVGDQNSGTFRANMQSTVIPSAPLGLLYQGDTGVPQGVYNTEYNRFAPRVGFAYDVYGNGRTSLRGGYGIFYAQGQESDTGNLQQVPFNLSESVSKTPNLVCPYGGSVGSCPIGTTPGANPFPFTYNPASPIFPSGGTTSIIATPANGNGTGYVEEYNLTMEQQLSSQWAISIGYVGNSARKLPLSHDINAPTYVPGAATTTAGINARRPYSPTSVSGFTFAAINLNDDVDNFNFNSLQASIRGQVGSRLNLLATYVWGKGMSYEGPVVNGRDISMDRGVASTDLRHNFSASVLYHLPGPALFGPAGKQVLGGWQINGLTLVQSGSPIIVISGVDTNLDGVTNDLPNIVGNPYSINAHTRAQKIAGYLNPAAFVTPAGPYGNEERDTLAGPMNMYTNASLFKTFPLFREAQLQFRAEAFNVFNNVNLGTPVLNAKTLNANLGTANQITSAGPPRILQFALKALF